ncbi:hypothetical protein NLI96_g6799 [Meripilus lineatus]|uniref:Putative peroxiredoxin n=1 Tax=Meripilus lineatus TaxID=2056292 RepID=A0AAD5YDI8_9APHY|nr:hypothetical protein NLI96_g6799 [Physisporinus lineatus]
MAPTIKVGDTIPKGTFQYIPSSPETDSLAACGIPIALSTDEWKGKKVVLVSVPGAFTPTCHVNHLPPFLEKYEEFKGKGVDVIAVVAANDAFVMSGWSKATGLKDKILALSDKYAEWSASLGLSLDLSGLGLGTRTNRYAIILDDLVVKYVEVEPAPGVTVSGAEAVLAALVLTPTFASPDVYHRTPKFHFLSIQSQSNFSMSKTQEGKKPIIDEDVDDLDDVLEQFVAPPTKQSGKAKVVNKPSPPTTQPTVPSASSTSTPSQKQPEKPPLGFEDLALSDDFTKELAAGMASLMREIAAESGSGLPETAEDGEQTDEEKEREKAFRKAWEDMLVEGMNGALDMKDLGLEGDGVESKDKGVEVPEDAFQSSIRKAMEKMKESEEKIQSESGSAGSDPLEALLSQLGEGGESEDELQGILESMMSQLMSKDILYEPLKELGEKFPTYLKENDATIKPEDKQRYVSQQIIVTKILSIFESPSYSDKNSEQGAQVVVLMNEVREPSFYHLSKPPIHIIYVQMQSLGSPPPEIMGPLPPGLDVGPDGMPKLPDGCCVA